MIKWEQFLSERMIPIAFFATPWTCVYVLNVCVKVQDFLRDASFVKNADKVILMPKMVSNSFYPQKFWIWSLIYQKQRLLCEKEHSNWLAHQNAKIKQKVIILYLS